MPTKKKRVGFIPREDVMRIIDKLSIENNLSNSKIISILVEEALSIRGIFNKKNGKAIHSYELDKDNSKKLSNNSNKFIDNETTYSELDKYANKVAQGLISLDCKPDSRVAFLGKNSDQFFEFLYGTIKSNTVTVGINWRLAPPEVAYIINDSQSEVLLVGPEFFGLVEEIKNDIPTVKKIIAVGGHHEEWEEYTNWRDSQDDSDPMLPSNGEDDVIQLYTSGTTGHPKGVQLTNDNFSSCFVMNDDSMYREMNEGEVNLVCMPIFLSLIHISEPTRPY